MKLIRKSAYIRVYEVSGKQWSVWHGPGVEWTDAQVAAAIRKARERECDEPS